MLISLLPNLLALLSVVGRVNRVVDADHHDQSPGEGYKDPVGIQRVGTVSFASSEWIEYHDGLSKMKLSIIKKGIESLEEGSPGYNQKY